MATARKAKAGKATETRPEPGSRERAAIEVATARLAVVARGVSEPSDFPNDFGKTGDA